MNKTELIADIDKFIKEKKNEIFDDLSALISIPSVKGEPDGERLFGKECGEVLEKVLEIGDGYGFHTCNHDYYCGSILYGDKDKSHDELGIVTHLDVVPVGDGWNFEPFALTEKDGLYIGRGTEDDKGPAVAALYALRYLKERGVKLPFDVRLIMGCDEETGMTDLPYYLQKMKPPMFSFTPDSEYPVCVGEKGIAGVEIELGKLSGFFHDFSGGNATNAVPDRASAVINGVNGKETITAEGRAQHAAYPEGSVNAIAVLAEKLCDMTAVNNSDKKILLFLKAALSDYYGKHFGIEMSDIESGKLTCIGGIIKTVDGTLVLNINIRYPVTKNIGEVFGKLSMKMEEQGFSTRLLYDKPPYYKSPDSSEIRALMDAYKAVTGRDDKPYTMGGGTYARAFPDCVAFGASFADCKGLLGEGRGGPHERDEYITKKEMFDSIKIFVLSLINLGAR